MKKRRLWIGLTAALAAMMCLCVFLAGCGEEDKVTAVEITNKTELTAEWYEGGADRTVQVRLTPDKFTAENTEVTVTSSKTDAVAVDGMTLKAVGAGTAVITVAAGDKTDTVSVTVKPVLAGIEITNKDALTAQWLVGDAARTVEVALSPDDFTTENTEVTVTSSNPAAVKAEGMQLTAVGVGTAEITVSAGGFSDKFTVSVRPQLESISISNKQALAADWVLGSGTRTIEIAFAPSDYYNAENTQVTVTSSAPDIVSADGLILTAKTTGPAEITVSAGGKSDSFTVRAVVTDPAVQAAEAAVDTYAETQTELPAVTATACDGTDLTADLEFVLSDSKNMSVEDGKITVAQPGVYTISYSVADPRDDSKIGTCVITVNAFRKVFGTVSGTNLSAAVNMVEGLAADENQTAQVTDEKAPKSDWVFAQFNMQPGKLYYAEVTYDIKIPQLIEGTDRYENDYNAGDMCIGMSHSVQGDGSRWLVSGVDRRDRNYKLKDMDIYNDLDWANMDQSSSVSPVIYSFQLANYRGFSDPDDSKLKYAVARDGDFFYFFINDQYVNGVTLEYYRDRDTVPGIAGFRMAETLIKNMAYCSGSEAEAKIAALLGSNVAKAYVPFDWAIDSKNPDNFTVGEWTQEKGANFTFNKSDTNGNTGMVSPYLYFDGDFTFEWEYRNTGYSESLNGSANEPRMYIDIRPWDYSETWIQFGAEYRPASEQNRQTRVFANRMDAGVTGNYQEGLHWFDGHDGKDDFGAKFSVTRRIKGDIAEYTFTVIPYADANKTPQDEIFTRTLEFDGNFQAYGQSYSIDPTGIVQILWHNQGVSGEYSNINWYIPDPVQA